LHTEFKMKVAIRAYDNAVFDGDRPGAGVKGHS
jgi:hypothetical protein